MAAIELTDALIRLPKRSDTAWVREVQDRRRRPSAEGGWSVYAHAEGTAAFKAWGHQVDVVHEAVEAWATESGQRHRGAPEGGVRGGKNPQVWP
ncbi:hypothetical protein ABZY44_23380 [Streptomyces sp. NPDC006544]|uniref:hypothetical protein n=1 Tax=Streptomyces sp. NPDC006544 TaxID=3154583 RepID=UPI0033BD05D7